MAITGTEHKNARGATIERDILEDPNLSKNAGGRKLNNVGGDGNCLFNALAEAIFDVLTHLQRTHQLNIIEASSAWTALFAKLNSVFPAKDWHELINQLRGLTEYDLQKKLAPVLRTVTTQHAMQQQDNLTVDTVRAAFNETGFAEYPSVIKSYRDSSDKKWTAYRQFMARDRVWGTWREALLLANFLQLNLRTTSNSESKDKVRTYSTREYALADAQAIATIHLFNSLDSHWQVFLDKDVKFNDRPVIAAARPVKEPLRTAAVLPPVVSISPNLNTNRNGSKTSVNKSTPGFFANTNNAATTTTSSFTPVTSLPLKPNVVPSYINYTSSSNPASTANYSSYNDANEFDVKVDNVTSVILALQALALFLEQLFEKIKQVSKPSETTTPTATTQGFFPQPPSIHSAASKASDAFDYGGLTSRTLTVI
ncbi:MAG: hypothetical protein Tsb005_05690 [Gammaproteobacteria bacterium]